MSGPLKLAGQIDENSLARLVNYLHEIDATGTLALTREGITKRLFFRDGDIVFAASTDNGDRLGEMLLKADKINVRQFEAATKVVIRTGKRLGGVLVELGYLKPRDLFWGVKYQVEEIVCGLFAWTDGAYEFTPGEIPSGEVITLHMSTANLILHGIRRIDDWTRIARGVPPMGSVLRLTKDPFLLYQDVDVTGEEKRVLSFFDGRRTIEEAVAESKMSEYDALRAAYVFYSIGMLEDVTEGKSAPGSLPSGRVPEAAPHMDRVSVQKAYFDAKGQNHYQLLGVDAEATGLEIKEAYERLTRLYHPDQQYRPGMEQMKGELEDLFGRVTEAYKVLSDDSRRWEYDLSLATAMTGRAAVSTGPGHARPKDQAAAREAFVQGVRSFKARDWESATLHFKEAARLDCTGATYFSHLALALLQRPKREAEAEEAMLAAIELEPANPEHRANLGLLYKKAGMEDHAKGAFLEALRLDPKNVKALKALGRK